MAAPSGDGNTGPFRHPHGRTTQGKGRPRPRATKDLDILVDPQPKNLRRVLAAVRACFGGADLGYTADDLADPASVIQIGVAPVRVDLMSSLAGCPDFSVLWRNRVKAPASARS